MNNAYHEYFKYLNTRSRLGLLYRNAFLYPRICSHLVGRVLDLGCGIGDFLSFRKNTVGTDVNPEAVRFCRDRGLDAICMDVDKLPFHTGEFDGVVLDNVLEHIISPGMLLDEIHRVLRRNGTLVVGVPGRKGFSKDNDHKIFYDEILVLETIVPRGFIHVSNFYMPLKSKILDRHLSQYCLYSKFTRS